MRNNPNRYSIYESFEGYLVQDEFGDVIAHGFANETEAKAWINEQIDNWEPSDSPGWEGGFADNH